jgi:hypothetical protein
MAKRKEEEGAVFRGVFEGWGVVKKKLCVAQGCPVRHLALGTGH